MTTDPTEAIRLIQSGLDKLGHSPGAVDGQWGVRTARALKSLLNANGRSPGAPVRSLIRYALTRMERLRPYLDHGILELDNNAAASGAFAEPGAGGRGSLTVGLEV